MKDLLPLLFSFTNWLLCQIYLKKLGNSFNSSRVALTIKSFTVSKRNKFPFNACLRRNITNRHYAITSPMHVKCLLERGKRNIFFLFVSFYLHLPVTIEQNCQQSDICMNQKKLRIRKWIFFRLWERKFFM